MDFYTCSLVCGASCKNYKTRTKQDQFQMTPIWGHITIYDIWYNDIKQHKYDIILLFVHAKQYLFNSWAHSNLRKSGDRKSNGILAWVNVTCERLGSSQWQKLTNDLLVELKPDKEKKLKSVKTSFYKCSFLLSTEGSLVIIRDYQPYSLVGPPV